LRRPPPRQHRLFQPSAQWQCHERGETTLVKDF
jgi:hypothetical protein